MEAAAAGGARPRPGPPWSVSFLRLGSWERKATRSLSGFLIMSQKVNGCLRPQSNVSVQETPGGVLPKGASHCVPRTLAGEDVSEGQVPTAV